MAKFNDAAVREAVTHEGAAGYARDPKSELYLLAVANMVGEKTYYEDAADRDARFEQLVHAVAVDDQAWTTGFVAWLRTEGNLRSSSLVAAAEATHALLAAGRPGGRELIGSVLQRADEPGEMLAYWTSRHGRALPKPVKRGVADAVRRLYSEYALLKYDTAAKGYRFADVIDLTHPAPVAPWQGDLFRVALERRHHRKARIPSSLTMVGLHQGLQRWAAEDPSVLLDADALKVAGMTWEDALSLAGPHVDKARLWTALIPAMGYMALLRNLRNFDRAGVSDAVAAQVAGRLSDPAQVARSKQFPFRFLAAHRAAPKARWGHALDKALSASLANVPELPGRTLILVDRSGSMFGAVSRRSELTDADAAAVFGAALAVRNFGRADLVEFGTGSQPIAVTAGESLLRVVDRFGNLGGTNTLSAVRRWYDGHDRVLIVTDEQAWAGQSKPGKLVPASVPLYTWNLAGYRVGHGPAGPERHTFGGLTDAAFRAIPLLEAGAGSGWPWENA